MAVSGKSCDWCFTWNNETLARLTLIVLNKNTETPGCIAFCTAQPEVATTGTAHLQGFVQFSSARSFGMVKALFPGAHVEKRHGSATQAKVYCNKPLAEGGNDAPAWEFGVFDPKNKQGGRSDVVAFKDAIKSMASDDVRVIYRPCMRHVHPRMLGVAYPLMFWGGGGGRLMRFAPSEPPPLRASQVLMDEHTDCYMRYSKMIPVIRGVVNAKRQERRTAEGVTVKILIGVTGSGKTRAIFDAYPDVYNVPLPSDSSKQPWFDGYNGQEVVLFDDFYGQIGYACMLQLCDRYKMTVQIKGGMVPWVPLKIFITSNESFNVWDGWKGVFDKSAFARRVVEDRGVAPVLPGAMNIYIV